MFHMGNNSSHSCIGYSEGVYCMVVADTCNHFSAYIHNAINSHSFVCCVASENLFSLLKRSMAFSSSFLNQRRLKNVFTLYTMYLLTVTSYPRVFFNSISYFYNFFNFSAIMKKIKTSLGRS